MPYDKTRFASGLDLLALLAAFWGVWSLRFVGVSQIGTASMLATGIVGLIILRQRGIPVAEVGLVRPRRRDLAVAFQAAGVIGIAYLLTPLLIWLLGPLSPSSAIQQQPQTLLGFLVDIVVFTWLGAALGEEFAFRGVILHRLRELFGTKKFSNVAAAGGQAVWFGFGHTSQGAAGIALTGLMGFGLALFFLSHKERSLTPLILAHAVVNTTVLTISYLAQTRG